VLVDEYHISSLVVHGKPAEIDAIRQAIEALPGAEVHGVGPTGKMVVTLETTVEQDILSRISDINLIDGVMSASLIYHQVDGPPGDNGEGVS
jgi:nitrate reductase NapD